MNKNNTFISLYIFIFLCSFHFKVSLSSTSVVTYYVNSQLTNSYGCGLTSNNACANIATAIEAYTKRNTNIPLIIELAGGLYLQDGNTQLAPVGMNITIQPQPNSDVTLNFGLQQLIYIDESAPQVESNTRISINSLKFINTPKLFYVITQSSNVSIFVDNCTFSDTIGIGGDYGTYVFDIRKDLNNNNAVEVDIRNSIFSTMNGGVLTGEVTTSITNTLITNTKAYNVITVLGTLNLSGVRYISNYASQHIFTMDCTTVAIHDSIFENNKNYSERDYSFIIQVGLSVDNLLIDNSSFNNNSGLNTIYLETVPNSIISKSNFTNNLAIDQEDYDSYRAAVIFYAFPSSKNSIISNCLFSNNTTPLNIIQIFGSTLEDSSFHIDNSRFENNIFLNISIAVDINLNQLNAIIENTIFNENQNIHPISCNSSSLIVSCNQFIGNSQSISIYKSKTCTINEKKCGSKLSGGQIAGIVVGCILFVAIVIILIVIYKKRQNPKHKYTLINSV